MPFSKFQFFQSTFHAIVWDGNDLLRQFVVKKHDTFIVIVPSIAVHNSIVPSHCGNAINKDTKLFVRDERFVVRASTATNSAIGLATQTQNETDKPDNITDDSHYLGIQTVAGEHIRQC